MENPSNSSTTMDSIKNPDHYSLKNVSLIVLLIGGVFFLSFISSFSSKSPLTSKLIQCPTPHRSEGALLKDELEVALENASMKNKTLIVAVVNKAYVEGEVVPNMLDLFLEGFWAGEGTRELVNHLLIVAVDQTAYDRCVFRGLHCYRLVTDGVDFMGEKVYLSDDFIKMMWRRTLLLSDILKKGYNFIFTICKRLAKSSRILEDLKALIKKTMWNKIGFGYAICYEQDTDVIWLRNPFKVLMTNKTRDFDIQFSVDNFNGNSSSSQNPINTGFYFVKSNNKTISLFEKWYDLKNKSGGLKEQDVLQKMIWRGVLGEQGVKARFLDTRFFSGFCQLSGDVRAVATVHSNCCRFISAKVADLQRILHDWSQIKVIPANVTSSFQWSPHTDCIHSWRRKLNVATEN